MKKTVKDHFGIQICEGMYVNENPFIQNSQHRQGWVTEVSSENDNTEKIKVKIVCKEGNFLEEQDFYVTEFEPSNNWCKALVDG